jgi:hypothetical protein
MSLVIPRPAVVTAPPVDARTTLQIARQLRMRVEAMVHEALATSPTDTVETDEPTEH